MGEKRGGQRPYSSQEERPSKLEDPEEGVEEM
jgi:hypothetical protein